MAAAEHRNIHEVHHKHNVDKESALLHLAAGFVQIFTAVVLQAWVALHAWGSSQPGVNVFPFQMD